MKKLITLFFLFITSFCFAQTFHISNVIYNISDGGKFSIGKTTPYALDQAVPVNKKSIFNNQNEFEDYLKKYNQQLSNTRAFETIEVLWQIDESLSSDTAYEIILTVNVKDSFHFLAIPHLISYNSNKGWKPKLKAKDTNFFGSLNTMSGDFYGIIPIASDNKNYEIGTELSFDIPFKAGIFDAQWINDYNFSYNFSKPTPEWDVKTGIRLSYPIDKIKLQLEFYQSAFRNYDFKEFDDLTYFKEEACFSIPFTLWTIKNWGDLYYKPYIDVYYNWDFNKINPDNTKLTSPTLYIGHSLYTNKFDWIGNYRKGGEVSLLNNYYYYFQRNEFIPYIEFEGKYYNFFKFFDSDYFSKLGIVSQLYAFTYFPDLSSKYIYGNTIGERLRGIRDDQNYADTTSFAFWNAMETSSAIVLNIDLPFHIMTTNFTNKYLSYVNCDVQFSPFLDIALCKNECTGKTFNLKDGFYAGGFEVLVYPKKWSSFIVRASLGLDLGRLLLSNYLNMDWRRKVSSYEISIGLGLQY